MSKSIIKVSIIIPIFNMEQYLGECLDSVLSQTLKEIEVICVNDGSNDGSKAILDRYSNKDKRIKVIDQSNKGTGMARNAGIDAARGENLAFMDPDDYYASKDALEKLYRAAHDNHAQMAGGNRVEKGIENEDILSYMRFDKEEVAKEKLPQCFYGHTRYLFQSKMIQENNIYNADSVYFEEQIFLLKAITTAQKICTIPDSVYVHRCYERRHFVIPVDKLVCRANAVLECFKYAAEHGYKQWAVDYLKDEPDKMVSALAVIDGNGSADFWERLRHIYIIEKEWLGQISEVEWTRNLFETKYAESKRVISEFENNMALKDKVLIYGAGNGARFVINYLNDYFPQIHIIGLAQSSMPIDRSAFGYDVKKISEYANDIDATVVVAVYNQETAKEMKKTATDLGFGRVCVAEIEKMKFTLSL